MKNKYWKISWGTIFDELDRKAHEKAIEEIWESVTSSSEIKFFKELDQELIIYGHEIIILNKTNKTVTIRIEKIWVVSATFTFIKRIL